MNRANPSHRAVCASLRLAVVSLAAVLTACAADPNKGYAQQSAFRSDVSTVTVPMFENTTFSHGLEIELTDAIVKEIHRTTPWKVVSSQADTSLEGAIVQSRLIKLSTQADSGLVQELGVELAVSFQWKDNTTGEVLVARRNFRGTDVFTPSRGAGERLEFGERATVDRLAKDIVAELRSSW